MQTTKSAKNPRKQRQRFFNAPAHIRHKLMSAHLAPDLMKSQGARSLPVRKGDTVRIMRGDHEGFEGKISRVDLANYRVFLEGLTREKVDGTVIFVAVHPSKVLIKTLNLDDKWRKRTLQRKKPLEQREESGLVVLPEEEEAKPVKAKEKAKPAKEEAKLAKAKVAEAKPKRAAKPKVEKFAEEEKPIEAEPTAPAEVKPAEEVKATEEEPAEEPVKRPRAPRTTAEKAEAKIAEAKPAEATKPAKKPRATKASKEAAPAEQKPVEAEATAEKSSKKAPVKKAPAKRKPKAAKESGGV